jgi:hypothetical protein
MCRRVECSRCGKPTYAGCGAHIEQVLGDVPLEQRCKCRDAGASVPPRRGLLDWLRGR